MGPRNWFSKSHTPAEPTPSKPDEEAPAPAPEPADEQPSVRIVIVDDSTFMRSFIRAAVEAGGFEVVGEADHGDAAIEVVAETKPDLVLLDLHMPDIGGLELLPHLREAHRPAKFVVLSAINATFMIESAIEAGAVGFIEKGVSIRSMNLHLDKIARAGSVKVVRPYPLSTEYA